MDLEKIKFLIEQLFDECLEQTKPFHRKLDLFLVPNSLVQKIFDSTGIDVSNHWVCIDNFGIIHTLEQHGNLLSEARRGQIAVDKMDFTKFIKVLLDADEIKSVGLTKRTNLPLIQFMKIVDDKKFVVKEVRTVTSTKKMKLSRLVFHTLYKIKADG